MEAGVDTAGTLPGSQRLLDTGTKVSTGVAETVLQLANLFSTEDSEYHAGVIEFQKNCRRLCRVQQLGSHTWDCQVCCMSELLVDVSVA